MIFVFVSSGAVLPAAQTRERPSVRTTKFVGKRTF